MEPPPAYTFRAASSDHDLRGILALQAVNLPETLSAAEFAAQGFVTLRHDLALLREMNSSWPHIIATPADSDEVVAYALVMQQKFRERLPLLEPMFQRLSGLNHRGRPIDALRWYVMGQICVAKAHRGRGLVEGMYAQHRAQMARDFDLSITEISRDNPRSLRAHVRAGWDIIHEFTADDGGEWSIVALDLHA